MGEESEQNFTKNQFFNVCIFVSAAETSDGKPPLTGASGPIVFHTETFAQIGRTTYLHWQIMDGKLNYLTYIGSDRDTKVGTGASWNIFYDEEAANKGFAAMAADRDPGIDYPALDDQYAVLVQGSNGMDDYRHLSDVLSVYQLLRKGGFDDDHIILILDASLANELGVVRNVYIGPDLLGGSDGLPRAVIDYSNDTLSVADVSHIIKSLTPNASASWSMVNVLLYWSGHGRKGEFVWRDGKAGSGFTAEMLRSTAEQMTYRKLLVIAEPCYGESVIRELQGLTGVLAMSSATGEEKSLAEFWDPNLGPYGTWMADRFTLNLVRFLTDHSVGGDLQSPTYLDLYLYCVRNTLGSHPKIVNASNFGNLYADSPQEFFVTINN